MLFLQSVRQYLEYFQLLILLCFLVWGCVGVVRVCRLGARREQTTSTIDPTTSNTIFRIILLNLPSLNWSRNIHHVILLRPHKAADATGLHSRLLPHPARHTNGFRIERGRASPTATEAEWA